MKAAKPKWERMRKAITNRVYPNLKLATILKERRRYGGEGEEAFARSLPGDTDEAGNRIVTINQPGGAMPRVLFSAHTDTVHRTEGAQSIVLADNGPGEHRMVKLRAKQARKECLGADDAAGCFILLSMIEARVPGLYVFHRGEEAGGIGSSYIAQQGTLLAGIDAAVAFDRRDYSDVITHQMGTRCASLGFAQALSDALTERGGFYMPSSDGVFTDTANYMDLVPECTNISVGYFNEHTAQEMVNFEHLKWLAEACASIDWHGLPVMRDPTAPDPDEITFLNWARNRSLSAMTDEQWGWYQFITDSPEEAAVFLADQYGECPW